MPLRHSLPYSFSYVANVWVPGAKTTGLIAKKFSNLKTCFTKVHFLIMGPVKNGGLFYIYQRNLAHSVDGPAKIIPLKLKSPKK
jgi:hypothetical protein